MIIKIMTISTDSFDRIQYYYQVFIIIVSIQLFVMTVVDTFFSPLCRVFWLSKSEEDNTQAHITWFSMRLQREIKPISSSTNPFYLRAR